MGKVKLFPTAEYTVKAAARPGGLQDAKQRDTVRSVGFREDRSPRLNDPRAI